VKLFPGFVVVCHGAYGNPNFQIFAAAAMTIAPLAMTPALRAKYMIEPEF
jgi:hypothetical protein